MDIARIDEILVTSLGEVDENQQPIDGCKVVNLCVTVIALKMDTVREYAAEMIELLQDWPSESHGEMIPALGQEISYIVAGAVLDDQRRALMLFAYGKLLDWWDILDPHTVLRLDYDHPLTRQMASAGLVHISGYRARLAT